MTAIPPIANVYEGYVHQRWVANLVERFHRILRVLDSRRVTKFPIVATFNSIASGDAPERRRIRIRPPVNLRLVGISAEVAAPSGYTGGDIGVYFSGTQRLTVSPVADGEASGYVGLRTTLNANTTYTFEVDDPPAAGTLDRVTLTLQCEHVASALVNFSAPIVRAGESFSRVNAWWAAARAAAQAILTRRRYWAIAAVHSGTPPSASQVLQLIHGVAVEARLERHTLDIDSGTATGTLGYAATTRTTGTCTAGTLLSEDPALAIDTTAGQNGLYLSYTNVSGTQNRVVHVLFLSRDA